MNEQFTPEFIREQRELAEKATKGEYAESEYDGSICAFGDGQGIVIGEIDRDVDSYYFCTAANYYIAALDEIERLRAELTRVQAALDLANARVETDFNDIKFPCRPIRTIKGHWIPYAPTDEKGDAA